MVSFLNKFLSKSMCRHINHCSFKDPYSELEFLNKNGASDAVLLKRK